MPAMIRYAVRRHKGQFRPPTSPARWVVHHRGTGETGRDATEGDPARRHGRLLRVGRAAASPRAARPPGGGGRGGREGRGRGRLLRGPLLRGALGDAVGTGPPAVPPRGLPRRGPPPLRAGLGPPDGALPLGHPARGAAEPP